MADDAQGRGGRRVESIPSPRPEKRSKVKFAAAVTLASGCGSRSGYFPRLARLFLLHAARGAAQRFSDPARPVTPTPPKTWTTSRKPWLRSGVRPG